MLRSVELLVQTWINHSGSCPAGARNVRHKELENREFGDDDNMVRQIYNLAHWSAEDYLLGHGHMPANYRKSLAMCDFLLSLSNVVVSVILKSLSANNDQICQHLQCSSCCTKYQLQKHINGSTTPTLLKIWQFQQTKYLSGNLECFIMMRLSCGGETQSKPEAQQDTKRQFYQSFFKTTKTREWHQQPWQGRLIEKAFLGCSDTQVARLLTSIHFN